MKMGQKSKTVHFDGNLEDGFKFEMTIYKENLSWDNNIYQHKLKILPGG